MMCPGSDLLVRYVSGETAPVQTEEIRQHVRSCPRCGEEAEAFQSLRSLLTGLGPRLGHVSPPGRCLDTATMAAYADRMLPEAERAAVERHLARCDACLHQLEAVGDWGEAVSAGWQPASPRLVAAALASKPLRPSKPPRRVQFVRQLQEWAERLLPPPGWLRVAVPACAGILLVLVTTTYLWPPQQGSQLRGRVKLRAGTGPASVITEGFTVLSPELRRALLAYRGEPTSEPRTRELLGVLERGQLRLPSDKVVVIEIQARIEREDLRKVKIRLFSNGRLVIADEP